MVTFLVVYQPFSESTSKRAKSGAFPDGDWEAIPLFCPLDGQDIVTKDSFSGVNSTFIFGVLPSAMTSVPFLMNELLQRRWGKSMQTFVDKTGTSQEFEIFKT